MYSVVTLEIRGYRDEPIPNTFFRQEHPADHLAVVLPGYEYTCDQPLLYYPVCLMLNRGADVLQVEYAYNRRREYQELPNADRQNWLFTDVTAACHAVLASRSYAQVTLIGKSIGTRAMGHLFTTDVRLSDAWAVWLTPLLRDEHLRARIRQGHQRSLFVIGTADTHYDPAYLDEARGTMDNAVVIEGADHSLEIAGDVLKSLDAMMRTMHALQAFVTTSERKTG